MPYKPESYYERAQRFIKGSRARGYKVRAEGSELIAYPPKKPFVPYYGGFGGKPSNCAGWGGERPAKMGIGMGKGQGLMKRVVKKFHNTRGKSGY